MSTSIPYTNRSTAAGFSLLEVITVLAICGVLVGIAAPQLRAFTTKTYLRGEAISLRLFLEKAVAYALASRQQVTVRLSDNKLYATTDSGDRIGLLSFRHGVTIEPSSIPNRSMVFRPSISASPATIDLQRGDLSCSVVVSLRGRVRVAC